MIRRTLIRAEKVCRDEEAKCATVLMERLRTTRSELFYVLDRLRQEGRVGSVNLGRVALWCASRAAAEEVLSKPSEALKSLFCRRGRFATPKKALQFIAEDKEMRKQFSRHMPLCYNTATIQIIDALMMRAFREPIEASRGRFYSIQCVYTNNTPTGIT